MENLLLVVTGKSKVCGYLLHKNSNNGEINLIDELSAKTAWSPVSLSWSKSSKLCCFINQSLQCVEILDDRLKSVQQIDGGNNVGFKQAAFIGNSFGGERLLAVVDGYNILQLFDRHSLSWTRCMTLEHTADFLCITVDQQNIVLCDSMKRAVTTFNRFSKESQSRVICDDTTDHKITALSASRFRKDLISVGYSDGRVQLMTIKDLQSVQVFSSHSKQISCIEFSPYNKYLMLSASHDGSMCLYDVEKLKVVKSIQVSDIPLISLSFYADGSTLAIATAAAGEVLIYNLSHSSSQALLHIDNFGHPVQCVSFKQTPAAHLLLATSLDSSTKIQVADYNSVIARNDAELEEIRLEKDLEKADKGIQCDAIIPQLINASSQTSAKTTANKITSIAVSRQSVQTQTDDLNLADDKGKEEEEVEMQKQQELMLFKEQVLRSVNNIQLDLMRHNEEMAKQLLHSIDDLIDRKFAQLLNLQ
ncbi:hypothetical protein MIR68_007307 [Amoeboaphelidium protococcarum]|nr:hypothetical protein MIR68_007307 [Amoeboaphelidium protococcarum]